MTTRKFFNRFFRQPAQRSWSRGARPAFPDRIEAEPDLPPEDAALGRDLLALAQSVQPDPEFVNHLEGDLARKRSAAQGLPSFGERLRLVMQTTWGWALPAGAVILLILIISLLVQMRPSPNIPSGPIPATNPSGIIDTYTSIPLASATYTPAPQATTTPFQTIYIVMPGDTLKSISEWFGVSPEAIMEANHLTSPDEIYPNQRLVIPESTQPAATPVIYIVQEGDTLLGVAAAFGVTPDAIFEANHMQSGDVLRVGMSLIIPPQSSSVSGGTPTPVATAANSVVPGEPVAFEVCGEAAAWRRPSEAEQKAKWWDNGRYAGASAETINYPWTHDFLVTYGSASLEYDLINLSGLWTLPDDVRAKCIEPTASDAVLNLRQAEVWALLHRVLSVSHVGADYYIVVEPADQGVQFIEFARPEQQVPLTLHFVTGDGQELDKIVEPESPYSPFYQPGGASPDQPNAASAAGDAAQALLAEMQGLVAKRRAALLNGPGWIYSQFHSTTSTHCGGVILPNGVFFPCEIDEHDWYELNDRGEVVTVITRQYDPSANLFQESVTRGGVSRNFTFGSEITVPLTSTYDTDWGFVESAAAALARGGSLSQEDRFQMAATGQRSLLLVEGDTLREAVFDPLTGGLLSLSTWIKDADGFTQTDSVEILEEGRVDKPPADALALLDQPLTPYHPLPPRGDPLPAGFDLTYSTLSLQTIFGDSFNNPTSFYSDISADGKYLVGRVDFGAVPAGYCQRSPDGLKLAFNRITLSDQGAPTQAQLRWLDLTSPADVHSGPPDLILASPPGWDASSARLAFIACDAALSCGLYTYDTRSEAVQRLADGGNAVPPAWSPDGTQIAYQTGPDEAPQTVVVDAASGVVIASPAWQPVFVDTPSGPSQCEQPPALAPTLPAAPADWLTYTNAEYGFTFRYPPDWTLEEQPGYIVLKRGTLQISIGFRRQNEAYVIRRTGTGAGDITPAGHVSFFGLSLPRQTLVYGGKVKAVFYTMGYLFEKARRDVLFSLSLDDFGLDYGAVNLSAELQQAVDQVVESFAWLP